VCLWELWSQICEQASVLVGVCGHRSVRKRVCLCELWSQICEQACVFVRVVVTDL